MKLNKFQKAVLISIIATLFLIFVGSLVRVSGSGLGCPDWPRCFGHWIPPLKASQLPNQFDPANFNVLKTWTEYINRLVGVLVGFCITITFLLSIKYRKTQPNIFYSSLAAWLLVIFQGWLGGQVVKSSLQAWMVTIHMVIALIIVNILIYSVFISIHDKIQIDISKAVAKYLSIIIFVLLGLTLIQIVLGTQVREAVDAVKMGSSFLPRSQWISNVGIINDIHKTFALTVFIGGCFLIFTAWKYKVLGKLKTLIYSLTGLILFQMLLGAGIEYLGVPPAYQILHLTVAAVLLCVEFYSLLLLYSEDVVIGKQ